MDFLNNEFRQSVGNYKEGANSIAQSALSGKTSLAEAQQSLAQAGLNAKSNEGMGEISGKIATAGQKFAKELGIDVSLSPGVGGLSKLLKYGGNSAGQAGKRFAYEGEGSMAESANAYGTPQNLGVGRNTGEDYAKTDDDALPKTKPTTTERPEADLGGEDFPSVATEGKFAFEAGKGGVINTGEDTTITTEVPPPVAPPVVATGGGGSALTPGNIGPRNPVAPPVAGDAAGANTINDGVARPLGRAGGGDGAIQNIEDATANVTESVAGTLLDAGGTVLKGIGGFLGDIMPFVGPIMAGVGLYEGFHDLNKKYGASGDDPYSAIRTQINAGQQKINAMSNNISADQFASKVGGGTPSFGSLAAPTMSSAQQTTGSGHF